MKAIILYMWTVYVGAQPVYIQHARTNPEERAYVLQEAFTNAGEHPDFPQYVHARYLLLALAWTESGLDGSRVGDVGELGIMQLHPRSAAGRKYAKRCPVPSRSCDALSIALGTSELAKGYKACGYDWGQAIGYYKSGRCIEGPRARDVMVLWDWLVRRDTDQKAEAGDVGARVTQALERTYGRNPVYQ